MQIPHKRYKWLLIPMENYVREFYGKLLFAAVAAERGWGTVMAYKGDIRFNPPDINGVVIEMNMTSNERVSKYMSHGWRVSAWDEEGIVYDNRDVYAHRRLNDEALKKFDFVFMWGDNQYKDVLYYNNAIQEKLVLTGNPRFDLLRPDLRDFYSQDATALQRKYGKYILINTTFGDVNHYFGKGYTGKVLTGKITTKEQELDQIAREKHKEQLLHAFIDMLPALSTHFPEHKIIIRPHPSENFETWISAAKDLPNVMMIHEGDPVPWILGAEVVVHDSCTTGVQAYLLGRPVVTYRPVRSDKYDMYLPNALSDEAKDIDQLVALIRQLIMDRGSIDQKAEKEKRLVAQEYITGLEGPWAADRIMDQMEKLDIHAQIFDNNYFNKINKNCDPPVDLITNLKGKLKHFLMRENTDITFRDWLMQLLKGKRPVSSQTRQKDWETYRRQRFPILSYNEIQTDFKRLQKISGRFSNVRVGLTKNNFVYIYPIKNKD
jgi:surface carbohydrate biosynthesis protein